jgi:pentatricopeptide repeat protein
MSARSLSSNKQRSQRNAIDKAQRGLSYSLKRLQDAALPDYRAVSACIVAANKLVAAESRAGHLQECEDVFELMQRECLHPDAYTYNGLIHAAVKCNNSKAAWKWFEAVQADDAVQADVISYNTILAMECNDNRIERALQLFSTMDRQGLVDKVTYNTLLQAMYRNDMHQRAQEVFAVAQTQPRSVDGTTVALGMKILVKQDKDEEALELLDMLPKYGRGLCSQTVSTAMAIHNRKQRYEDARQLFMQLHESVHPDEASCCELVGSFKCNVDPLSDWVCAHRHQGLGLTPCMLGYMLRTVLDTNGTLESERFMARLTGGSRVVTAAVLPLDPIVFTILINGIAQDPVLVTSGVVTGRSERCRFWLREMDKLNIKVNLMVITAFLNALGMDGNAPELVAEFNRWRTRFDFDEKAFRTVISWLSRLGCVDEVNAALQAMPRHINKGFCIGTARQQLPEDQVCNLKPHPDLPRVQRNMRAQPRRPSGTSSSDWRRSSNLKA